MGKGGYRPKPLPSFPACGFVPAIFGLGGSVLILNFTSAFSSSNADQQQTQNPVPSDADWIATATATPNCDLSMVYQGKPSRGCGTCRQRRVKCDERKPTCFRCEKARRTCTGYRPEFEIIHRNENQVLERRMRLSAAAGSSKGALATARTQSLSSGNSGGGSSRARIASRVWTLPASEGERPILIREHGPGPSLRQSFEEQASCHFASNFILVPLQDNAGGHFDFLLPLIAVAPPRSPLRHAFRACAYASLGGTRWTGNVNMSAMALAHHSEALAQTHLALSNPAAATSDAIVATVLLLCLFENMTATKETGMLAWRSHIEGAVQIIKSRGAKQLETVVGRRLFTSVRHHLCARTLSSGMLPPSGVDWWTNVDSEARSAQASCQSFALKTSQLRAEVSRIMTTVRREPESIEVMLELARRVQAVDQEIASWIVSLPRDFHFRTLCWQEHPTLQSPDLAHTDVFPGRVDVYPDFVVAETWNTARAARLILQSLNIRVTAWICSPVDYHTTPEYATSKRICEGTIADMIASIPYHLGWHVRRKELFQNPELAGFACGEDGPMKTLPASFAVWPLACISCHDMATDAQRSWCQGRLRYIARELGLQYAQLLAASTIRFPSMMIRQDGLMLSPDPLHLKVGTGLKVSR